MARRAMKESIASCAASDTEAAGFSPQVAARTISYLATEKSTLADCYDVRVVLDCLVVQRDALRYPEVYRLMSFEFRLK